MTKKKKFFLNFTNYVTIVGIFYFLLFFISYLTTNKNYSFFEYIINGFGGLFRSHYIYEDYLNFTSEFLFSITFLFIGAFFLIFGLSLKKNIKIPVIIFVFFNLYLILLFSYRVYESSVYGIDFSSILFIIPSAFFILFIGKSNRRKKTDETSKTWVIIFILIFSFVSTLITSLYEYIDRVNVAVNYHQKKFQKINKGLPTKKVLEICGPPYIKLLIFQSETEGSFYIPIINGEFKEEHLVFGLYASGYIQKTSNHGYSRIIDEKAPENAGSEMSEDGIRNKFGIPTREIWLYLKKRDQREVKYKTIVFFEGNLQSVITYIHNSFGIIRHLTES